MPDFHDAPFSAARLTAAFCNQTLLIQPPGEGLFFGAKYALQGHPTTTTPYKEPDTDPGPRCCSE